MAAVKGAMVCKGGTGGDLKGAKAATGAKGHIIGSKAAMTGD